MIKNYIKTAWRNLRRDKAHSFINILGLAVGMAVVILIGLWLYDEISFDRNFEHYDRIAQVEQNVLNNGEVATWTSVPYPLADELRNNYGSDFKRIVMSVDFREHTLTVGSKKLQQIGCYFEKGIADMLSLQMLNGNREGLRDPGSVLVSESAAKACFGNEDPMNKMLKIDDNPPVKVTGIYRDIPHNSTFGDLHFIAPWELFFSSNNLNSMKDPWRPNFVQLLVQLNENADLQVVSLKIKDAKLKKVNEQLQKKKPVLFLHPMNKWHLYSEFKDGVNTGGEIQYVWMFGMIGAFVLFLACINFMNLSTAKSEKRAREVGIRKTLGSLRRQLILQFFAESALVVFFAFICSLLLVSLALPFFNEVAGKQMTMPWGRAFFWPAAIVFILVTAWIAGSYPAFYLSSFRPVRVLKGAFKAGRFAAIPRKALVVVQFTVSVALIIGTMIVYKQIQFAKNQPIGYSRNNLVAIPSSKEIRDHFAALQQELASTGLISGSAEASALPTGGTGSSSGFSWPGKDPNLSIDFNREGISYEYGKTIGWQLSQGRDFSKDFLSDSSALILNEAAVKFIGFANPVGQTMYWFDKPYKVIGVTKDIIMQSPYDAVRPTVFFLSKDDYDAILLRINPAVSAQQAIARIGELYKKYNPDRPFEYRFASEEFEKKFLGEERIGKLATFFTILAIFISCLGISGMASFAAEQRIKEIGVRKVLGASVFNLWKLLSQDFLIMVMIALIIATPLAFYFMHSWLQHYHYRTTLSWWIFALAGVGAVIITLATVSFQSVKAALANPVKSLRTE
jgi:putative ABC transport system permease protein